MYPISGNTKAHTFWGVFLSLLSYHSNRRHGAVFARNVPSFLNFYAVDQQGPAVPHPLFPTRVGIAQCHGAVSWTFGYISGLTVQRDSTGIKSHKLSQLAG